MDKKTKDIIIEYLKTRVKYSSTNNLKDYDLNMNNCIDDLIYDINNSK